MEAWEWMGNGRRDRQAGAWQGPLRLSTACTRRWTLRKQYLTSGGEGAEVATVAVLRRLLLGGHLPARRAGPVLSGLFELPLRRVPHRVLLSRRWSLRDNLTIYDASYVALAEQLGVVLVTADTRLCQAPGLRCQVEVLARSQGNGQAAP